MLPSCVIRKSHARPFSFPRLKRYILQARVFPLAPALFSLPLLSVLPTLCGFPVSHLPYTLPSSVSRKSCVCHSYAPFASRTFLRDENCRGVYQQFPTWNCLDSANGAIPQHISSLPTAHYPLPTAQYFSNSFISNTYTPPRMCCKQRTYGIANLFRIRTYKKHGVEGFSVLPTPHCSLPTAHSLHVR